MQPPSIRRAVVVFDTRFGNTRKVAEALVRGLNRTPGVEAVLSEAAATSISQVEGADLIAVGGPTESFGESRHLKEMFARLAAYDLRNKFGFAFDTHAPGRWHGSAARSIESELKALGVEILQPRLSGLTQRSPGGSAPAPSGQIQLTAGTEPEFETLGALLGTTLLEAALRVHQKLMEAPEPESTAP